MLSQHLCNANNLSSFFQALITFTSYLYSRVCDTPVKFAGKLTFNLNAGFIRWETIVSDDLSIVLCSGFGDPGSVWFTEVNIEKASSNTVAIIPLKPIHQCPGCVSKYLHAIELDGCKINKKTFVFV